MIKWTYDVIADAIYVSLELGDVRATAALTERVIVDLDANGKLIGVELLDVQRQPFDISVLADHVDDGDLELIASVVTSSWRNRLRISTSSPTRTPTGNPSSVCAQEPRSLVTA
jgi:uncharacterized protein YuzE